MFTNVQACRLVFRRQSTVCHVQRYFRWQAGVKRHAWRTADIGQNSTFRNAGLLGTPRTWNAKLGDSYDGPKARHHFTRYAVPYRAHERSLRIDNPTASMIEISYFHLLCNREALSLFLSAILLTKSRLAGKIAPIELTDVTDAQVKNRVFRGNKRRIGKIICQYNYLWETEEFIPRNISFVNS